VFYYLNLDDKTTSEIMSAIVKNIDEHPILSGDMQKLNEKVKQCKLCERKGK
jgi:hypothetical protein